MTPPHPNEAEAVMHANAYYPLAERQGTRGFYFICKRGIDIMASLAGLFLLAPLFIVLAVLIKLEDPRGAVFFSQIRIGKDEKPFRMYKFRSMVSNAEELLQDLLHQNEISGAMFKMKEDPRITRIGRIIRKTSIDELPQLFNVLKGDMSLVGPRPPLPREVEEYTDYDKLRLTVTPGCTGLWQVSGRNELSFAEMVQLDLEYIEQRSPMLDTKILFKTVKVMAGSKDAF